jgi:hypothetical protein
MNWTKRDCSLIATSNHLTSLYAISRRMSGHLLKKLKNWIYSRARARCAKSVGAVAIVAREVLTCTGIGQPGGRHMLRRGCLTERLNISPSQATDTSLDLKTRLAS